MSCADRQSPYVTQTVWTPLLSLLSAGVNLALQCPALKYCVSVLLSLFGVFIGIVVVVLETRSHRVSGWSRTPREIPNL